MLPRWPDVLEPLHAINDLERYPGNDICVCVCEKDRQTDRQTETLLSGELMFRELFSSEFIFDEFLSGEICPVSFYLYSV